MNDEFDVTGNIKIIEFLKTELIGSVAALYRVLNKGSKITQDALSECLAGIIIIAYILAKRLGIEFSAIDLKVQNQLKIGILEEDEIEKNYNDLSRLLGHLRDRKKD
ncbi:MazG-like family protein [Oxobacter pfennigii]|uniref:MazG-like family protein n=1 Tax=Oxobacter pfennigii TaxID=36849 RepID=A0A0P8WX57_9CLOT|nr:MazG-like family protein [Oxobacter pfennigii]KPU42902.1 MazG-like family protein [Oxobacter pfennigii]